MLAALLLALASPSLPTPEQRVRWADAIVVFRAKEEPKTKGGLFTVVVEETLKGPVKLGELRVRREEPGPGIHYGKPGWYGTKRGILYLRGSEIVDFTDFDNDYDLRPKETHPELIRQHKGVLRFFAELETLDAEPGKAVDLWIEGLGCGNEHLTHLLLYRMHDDYGFDDDADLQELQRRQREAGRAVLLERALRMTDSPGALRAVRDLARDADRDEAMRVARKALEGSGPTAPEGLLLAARFEPELARDTALAWIAEGRDAGAALRALGDVAGRVDLKRAVGPMIRLLDSEEHRGAARRILERVVGNPGKSVPEWKRWWEESGG